MKKPLRGEALKTTVMASARMIFAALPQRRTAIDPPCNLEEISVTVFKRTNLTSIKR
jgi:hypothetical protein